MDEFIWRINNYSTKVMEDTENGDSTVAMSTTWRPAAKQAVSAKALASISLIITLVGIVTNAGVLTVLVRARRHFSSCVHTLIANQCAMDLFTSVFGVATIVMLLTRVYRYSGNAIVDGTICMLFEGRALTALGVTASKFGLILITIERYVKIVHAIAHRKYWRSWMTTVGVALPWIGGMCMVRSQQWVQQEL